MSERSDEFQASYGRVPAERTGGGTVPLTMLDVHQGAHRTTSTMGDHYVFGVLRSSAIGRATIDGCDGRRVLSGRRGSIAVYLPHTDLTFDVDGEHHALLLCADRGAVDEALDAVGIGGPEPLRHLHTADLFDPTLDRAMRAIWDEAKTGDAASQLAIDGLFSVVLSRSVRLESAGAGRTAALSSHEIARIAVHVHERIAEKLTTADLADVVGYSPFHFSRAFKGATGETPHSFVSQMRVERAKDLLNAKRPIPEVAFACGFCSQSHLTQVFKRHTGTTPGAFRRAAGA